MSDWSDEIQGYTERNYDDLVEEFIEKNSKLWNDFVSNKFFNSSLGERMGVGE